MFLWAWVPFLIVMCLYGIDKSGYYSIYSGSQIEKHISMSESNWFCRGISVDQKNFKMDFLWDKTTNWLIICNKQLNMFPALSVDAVQQTFGAPRQLPLKKSSAKIPVINDGVVSALDANMPSQGPPESWLLICSHQTSAVEAPNIVGMANQACRPWRETYTTHMCRICGRNLWTSGTMICWRVVPWTS